MDIHFRRESLNCLRKVDYKKEIDEILELLQNNFPANHTEEQFIWKHLENLFGQSFDSVAKAGKDSIPISRNFCSDKVQFKPFLQSDLKMFLSTHHA